MTGRSSKPGHGAFKFRRIVFWALFTSISLPFFYVLASEIPAYLRRSELQSRVFRGRTTWMASPYQNEMTYFHSRTRVPNFVTKLVAEDWLRPLEPFTVASLVPKSDDDVRKLAPEVELERVVIIAGDGKRTEQLLQHLIALPKLHSLSLCNVPITNQGIDLLLRIPRLKELYIECASEPSPGLMRLSELAFIEDFGLMDARYPVSDEVYQQIGKMPKLQVLGLPGTTITASRCQAIASSPTLERISFAYMDCNLTLEHARMLAKMKSIRSVQFRNWHESVVDPDAQEYLQERGLIPEEEMLLTSPRL